MVPGIFLEAVLIGGMTTALALATDLQAGMIDRFRSLPMARSAFLAGLNPGTICVERCWPWHSSSASESLSASGSTTASEPASGGVALIIGFGYAFTWVYAAIGLAVKDPQTAQMTSILPMFILFFAEFRLGAGGDHAELAAALRREPAGGGDDQLGAGTLRRRALVPRSVASGVVVHRDLGGLLRDFAEPLPT